MKGTSEASTNGQAPDAESSKKPAGNAMSGQIHNILMDEFKKAHQKMFKNGYVENEYQQQGGQNGETSAITAPLDNGERKVS